MSSTVQGHVSGYGLALHYQPHRSAEQLKADQTRYANNGRLDEECSDEELAMRYLTRHAPDDHDLLAEALGLIEAPVVDEPTTPVVTFPRDKNGNRLYLRICPDCGDEKWVTKRPPVNKPTRCNLCELAYMRAKKKAAA